MEITLILSDFAHTDQKKQICKKRIVKNRRSKTLNEDLKKFKRSLECFYKICFLRHLLKEHLCEL